MVIETEKLTKFYGEKIGCKEVTISVREGEIFGFLGPNGAGKSTFIKMMVGLLFPTSGTATILQKPLGDIEARKKIGYLPENFKYHDWMTGVDLLSFHASLYKLDRSVIKQRSEQVLKLVKLKGNEKYKIGTYSKGMQQRIGIACALLPDPDLLFLDEPTSALDPIGRKEVREIMLELKGRGKTVLLNSHLLSEVEMVCDSAAIINKGSIIEQGSLNHILKEKTILTVRAENMNMDIISKLKAFDPELEYKNDSVSMKINKKDDVHIVASIIIENGGRLYELTPRRESLENLFINLIEGGEKQ